MSDSSVSDFNKISSTALAVAYVRQISGIAYTREIVELTRAEEIARQFESQGQLQFLDERVRKYRLQLADKSRHEASSEASF